jgi:hypothetical protein
VRSVQLASDLVYRAELLQHENLCSIQDTFSKLEKPEELDLAFASYAGRFPTIETPSRWSALVLLADPAEPTVRPPPSGQRRGDYRDAMSVESD